MSSALSPAPPRPPGCLLYGAALCWPAAVLLTLCLPRWWGGIVAAVHPQKLQLSLQLL